MRLAIFLLLLTAAFALNLKKLLEVNLSGVQSYEITMNSDRYFTVLSQKFNARFSFEHNQITRHSITRSRQLPLFGSICSIDDHSVYLLGQSGSQLSSKIYELTDEGSVIKDISNTKSLNFPTRIKTSTYNNGTHCFFSGGALVRGGKLSDLFVWSKKGGELLTKSFVTGTDHSILYKDNKVYSFANERAVTIFDIEKNSTSTQKLDVFQAGTSQKALLYGNKILVLSEVGSKIYVNTISSELKVEKVEELVLNEVGKINAIFVNDENFVPHLLICKQNCHLYNIETPATSEKCEDGQFLGVAAGGDSVKCIDCKPGFNCVNGQLKECNMNTFQSFRGASVCQICFGKIVKNSDGHHISCSVTSYRTPALLAMSSMCITLFVILITNFTKKKHRKSSISFI